MKKGRGFQNLSRETGKKVATKIPTKVPSDYKQFDNFKPCFGYYYCVTYGDDDPAFFTVNKNKMIIQRSPKILTMSLSFMNHMMTIESSKRSSLTKKLDFYLAEANEFINFTAKPQVNKVFKDRHGLLVLPFKIVAFEGEKEYEAKCRENSKQARCFLIT